MSKEMEMCYSIQKHISIWLLELNRKIRRILSLWESEEKVDVHEFVD